MKLIPLRNCNLVVLVDDSDYDYLAQFNWFPQFSTFTCYATRNVKRDDRWTRVQMHRELLKPPGRLDVDHKDLNGLNNQRWNLRPCSRSFNIQRKRTHSASGLRGVYFDAERGWRARLMIDGAFTHLGYFENSTEAAAAYTKAALKHFGALAGIN